MTDNERTIFELIRKNPFISQQELADKIGLSRSAVANIISALVKKEYLLGKAYIFNERNAIVCIGAANLDKKIKTDHELQGYTSNPITSKVSIGGVVRNIAENLGRLEQEVILISTVGSDPEWSRIKALSSPFMNTESVITLEGQSTGCYTALLDIDGEMYLGLADMSIYDHFKPELLIKRQQYLRNAKCLVVDLNCPKETVEFLCAYATKHQIKLAVIAVSEPKMKHLPRQLAGVDCLFINKGELGAFVGRVLNTDESLKSAVNEVLDLGVKQIILTAGAKGVLSANQSHYQWYPVKQLASSKIVDVTGAGDSFSAAYIDAWLQNQPEPQCILAGMVNAYHTIQSEFTVRPNLTKAQLQTEMEHFYE
ncbi:carbohydrate kinase [Actinobacillus porcinus]|uniref:carbohydrate kinase n=1 Tax=Actinobacillus porcinus TaxID=51048 RepID=UPI00235673A3|nr:winged helix-turn-helix transcriptional regulator [Actinobacillus porcinus]MDY6215380.1 winged helix-turn-helix transcriptional regulator [Actinobacillus porcinus]